MAKISKYHLQISPQTHIRTTQGDRKCFRIPEQILKEKYPEMLLRKKRIERYNQYKADLFDEALAKGFVIPDQGMDITFFIPVPPSWRPGKKKKYHLQPHKPRPDVDNLLKAMIDALRPSKKKYRDSSIWHLAGLTKIWVDFPIGWIEVSIKEPVLPASAYQIPKDQLQISFPKMITKRKRLRPKMLILA